MIDHHSYTHNFNADLNGIRIHDLCDAGTVLYKLNS